MTAGRPFPFGTPQGRWLIDAVPCLGHAELERLIGGLPQVRVSCGADTLTR